MTREPRSAPRVRDGVRAALPLAPGPLLFGLSFGVLADAAGMGAVAATVMSATTFAGSAQFAAVTVLDAGRRRHKGIPFSERPRRLSALFIPSSFRKATNNFFKLLIIFIIATEN